MKFLFRNETSLNKIILCSKVMSFSSLDSWMSLETGEGGKEIENHGRLRVKSFSQETVAKVQRAPRNGSYGQMLKSLKCRMHERFRTQLPFFFFSSWRPGCQ